jgi:hypothetical protein
MTLPYGSQRCNGRHSPVNPGSWIPPCMSCARRLQPADHAWTVYIEPPAEHVDGAWQCGKFVEWIGSAA